MCRKSSMIGSCCDVLQWRAQCLCWEEQCCFIKWPRRELQCASAAAGLGFALMPEQECAGPVAAWYPSLLSGVCFLQVESMSKELIAWQQIMREAKTHLRATGKMGKFNLLKKKISFTFHGLHAVLHCFITFLHGNLGKHLEKCTVFGRLR